MSRIATMSARLIAARAMLNVGVLRTDSKHNSAHTVAMIHSDVEYARVSHLGAVLAHVLRYIAASVPPAEASVTAHLRASYAILIPALQDELRQYAARRAQAGSDPTCYARWQIETIEDALALLRTQFDLLHGARHHDRETISRTRNAVTIYEDLLTDWYAIFEALIAEHPTDWNLQA